MKSFFCPIICCALIFGFGCSTATLNKSKDADTAFASPSDLTAALTNGNNIILHWKNNSTTDGGNWVEFATPGSEYVQLDVFMSDANGSTFVHPRVAPQTTFIYRIHPFFGKTAGPVEITTGIPTTNSPSLGEGPIASTNEIASGKQTEKFSIRAMRTFAEAAPTDIEATLSSPTSVDLHWKDCASDEDGYFLEIAPSGGGKFYACALLPPDTTSFRKTGLPPNTKCYFRVRAYFYGKPSDPASINTSPK
jgi:hypothetical protein